MNLPCRMLIFKISQVHLQTLELGDCTNAPYSLFKTLSDLTRYFILGNWPNQSQRPDQATEVETGTWGSIRECWQACKCSKTPAAWAGGLQHWGGVQGRPQSRQEHQEAAHHPHLSGMSASDLDPKTDVYIWSQDEVAKINSEIISGVTEEMRQLQVCHSLLSFQHSHIKEMHSVTWRSFLIHISKKWAFLPEGILPGRHQWMAGGNGIGHGDSQEGSFLKIFWVNRVLTFSW